MNLISIAALCLLMICLIATLWRLNSWERELEAFQDATLDMLADASLDVSKLEKRVIALEETAAALCERADKIDEEHAEQVEQALQMAQDFSNGVSNMMNYTYLEAGKRGVNGDA